MLRRTKNYERFARPKPLALSRSWCRLMSLVEAGLVDGYVVGKYVVGARQEHVVDPVKGPLKGLFEFLVFGVRVVWQ